MDEETKDFFSKLSNSAEEINREVEAEFVKAPSTARKVEAMQSDDFGEVGELTVDVYQTPDAIFIEAPIAGVAEEDLDVAITNDSVTIKGKRERRSKVKSGDFLLEECFWGKFSRSIILPEEIDAESAGAAIESGILVVHLPKIKREKSKKLKVKFQ